jgi:hypothetical protein
VRSERVDGMRFGCGCGCVLTQRRLLFFFLECAFAAVADGGTVSREKKLYACIGSAQSA